MPRTAPCAIGPSSCGMLPDARHLEGSPGEGDVLATRPDGSKILRYQTASYDRELRGAVEECALYAGLGVDFVKDLPPANELIERLWRECQGAHRSKA